MLLSELKPELIFINGDGSFDVVKTLEESHGLFFDCPLCLGKNPEFPHQTFILNENAIQEGNKWNMSGELENLSVVPSILFRLPCGAHFWIRNGEIVGLTEEK